MARKKSNGVAAEDVEKLKKELAKLEKENEALKHTIEKEVNHKVKKPYDWLRRLAIVLLLTVGVVSFALYNISSWVKNTALNTDAFVETMQPVLADPAVQTAIQNEITTQLFARVDIESELQKALPENIAFLAGPLASQIESFTNSKVGEVIKSPQVYDLWGNALRTIHYELITYIENDSNDGVISVNDVYDAISAKVSEDKKISFLLNKQLPEKIGTITLAEVTWLPQAREYVKVLNTAPIVFFAISAVCFSITILLATRRRMVLLAIVAFSLIMLLATLASLTYANWHIADLVQPQYADAAREIQATITNPLRDRTVGYIALGAVLFFVVLFTAPIESFIKARNFIDGNLYTGLTKILPSVSVPDWLTQFSKYSGIIAWTVFAIIFIGIGVRIPPEYAEVKMAFITATILVLLIYIANLVIRALARDEQDILARQKK